MEREEVYFEIWRGSGGVWNLKAHHKWDSERLGRRAHKTMTIAWGYVPKRVAADEVLPVIWRQIRGQMRGKRPRCAFRSLRSASVIASNGDIPGDITDWAMDVIADWVRGHRSWELRVRGRKVERTDTDTRVAVFKRRGRWYFCLHGYDRGLGWETDDFGPFATKAEARVAGEAVADEWVLVGAREAELHHLEDEECRRREAEWRLANAVKEDVK